MGLLSTLKSFGSGVKGYLGRNGSGTSTNIIPGFGSCGGVLAPFSAATAMNHFQHWAYAAMMLNANAVANVPLRLYARKPRREVKSYDYGHKTFKEFSRDQKQFLMGRVTDQPLSSYVRRKVAEYGEDLVELTEPHPALQVLDKVNSYQNGYELTVLRMLDLQIVGDSYLYPVLNKLGTPAEVVRIPPQYVTIHPGQIQFIDYYKFWGIDNREFTPEEIIQFKLPNPANVYSGRGWLEAAAGAVGLHDAKRLMDLAVFQNMARPDFLLAVKSGNKEGALDRFEEKIKGRNLGPRNAGKFLTITGDVSVTPLNWNTTAEVGTATRVIEEISAVSGVPVAMLLSNDPTKASSVMARLGWYRNTIRPYCRLDEEKLNERWLPYFDGAEEMFLCYDPVSFEDMEAQSKRVVAEVAGGVAMVNEGRAQLGYPAVPGGDKLYPPSGATAPGTTKPGDKNKPSGEGDNTDNTDEASTEDAATAA